MKWFKPFTPNYYKKEKRNNYWHRTMRELAVINGLEVDLKEKYGRMDATMYRGDEHHLVTETMEDYEAMSEERCMYCNKKAKQYWTHEDSWVIHLCLPCLIGDKVTILLEKAILRREKQDECMKWLQLVLLLEIVIFCIRIYIEIEYGKGTAQLPSDVHIRSELLNTGNSINK